MKEFDIPLTIRKQYLEEKQIHDENCVDGEIEYINKFSGQTRMEPCKYCKRFNKDSLDAS